MVEKRKIPAGSVWVMILFLVLGGVTTTIALNYWTIPKLTVCGVDIGLKTTSQAKQIVGNYLTLNYPQTIQATYFGKTIPIAVTSLKYSAEDNVNRFLKQGKTKIGRLMLPTKLVGAATSFQPIVDLKEIDQLATSVSANLDRPAIDPEIMLQTNKGIKSIKITDGETGEEIDRNKLIADLNQALTCPKPTITVEVTMKTTGQILSENQKQQTKTRAENLIGKSVKLTLEYQDWEAKEEQLISFLAFDGSYNQKALRDYAEEIGEAVSRDPVNAAFQFENGKVTLFRPAKDGLALDENTFVEEMTKALAKLEGNDEKTVELPIPVIKTPPPITNKEVNDLGINELVGRGTSLYHGSIPGRIHNLILASERLNGILIAPGEEFSFNKALGEVSTATGYQPAYVIKSGRTVLGDGGGVCQTSTTLFRAILNAGLPITERHAHAYRVHYYEDDLGPGYDATVFSPSVDLKFINDTPAYLLLQTRADKPKKQLIYELYGTSDGRVAEISKARIWARVPAPPALYQDDPTLPIGVVKQIDWAAPGAKTAFDYKVTRNGETLQEKTFNSDYRPWQAIYLKGTKTN